MIGRAAKGLPLLGAALASQMLVAVGSSHAETSSWSQRAPHSPQPSLSQPPVSGKPRLRSTLPAAPPAATGSKTDDAPPVFGPPPGLRRKLGPASAAPSGGPNAAYIAFEQGLYVTALDLARAEAANGSAPAFTLIGRIYADGLGVAKNATAAAEAYGEADQLGDTEGTFSLAMLYALGDGVEKDHATAARLFEKAARKGHAYAHYNLALAFLSGKGKPENPHRAAAHLRYASEQGLARAQYDLATLYLTGHGVKADAYQGALWLSRAADSGLTVAQYEYAVLLLQGRGINSDRPDMLTYLKSAALRGIPGAQNRLAHLFKDGTGVKQDVVEAAKWRLIAQAGGMKDQALDSFVQALPEDQRAAARRSARSFVETQALGARPGF